MIYGHTPTERLAPEPSTINTQRHYIGGTTIYKVAEDFKLNSYKFFKFAVIVSS